MTRVCVCVYLSSLAQWLQVHLFFTFFLSPISVSFAEKVNPWCLQLTLFFCFLGYSSLHLVSNPYSSPIRFGAKINFA